ncbi:helix-turn-helix domain-containing protein [Nocardia sp. NPDC059091]|uniref:helix-turn-helix domain-containing protein n=1 Tax=Nocardia sp. NPDC059091 TaxID=3346724 RepID=UPI003680F8E8
MRRHPSTVRELPERCGEVRLAARHQNELRLSLVEREEISCGLAAGDSLRGIVRRLGREASTRCSDDRLSPHICPRRHATPT